MKHSEIEARLQTLYERQLQWYHQLEPLVQSLQQQDGQDQTGNETMEQVAELMAKIAEIDTQLMPLRESWDQQNVKPGPTLTVTLKRLEDVILRVITAIERAEAKLNKAKRLLEPMMTREVKQRRMADAYAEAIARQ